MNRRLVMINGIGSSGGGPWWLVTTKMFMFMKNDLFLIFVQGVLFLFPFRLPP